MKKYQGLTVYIKWNKSYFSLEDDKSQTKISKIQKEINRFYISYPSALILLLGSIILFFYYFITWSIVGKDPKKLKIPPSTNITDKFSPAALRYIDKMGFDTKCISAAIISLASKGFCTIEWDKEKLILKKTGNQVDLSEDENEFAKLMFTNDNDSFTFNRNSYPVVQLIYQDYKKHLSNKYKNLYFVTNSIFYIIGIIFSLATFIFAILKALNEFEYGFLLLWLSIWSIGVIGLISATRQTWKARKFGGITSFIILLIFTIVFILAEAFVLIFFVSMVRIYSVIITKLTAFILILINTIYYKLLKRPTKEGIFIHEEILALEKFIKQIPQDLKNQNQDLNLTLEIDKLIAYALALDIEPDWFESIFNPHSSTTSTYYFQGTTSIPWVSLKGSNTYSAITYSCISSLFNFINSTISSSSSSSSLLSSGGSSGGGSGGGGGGW